MKALTVAAVAAAVLATGAPAHASTIENACVRSDRQAATRALCRCIQNAADQTLSRADQRQAARFFRDPDRAQAVRMSSDQRDSAFWQRYRAFADLAEARCQ